MRLLAWWGLGIGGLLGSAWLCTHLDVWWQHQQAEAERRRIADCLERLQREITR